ncbi:MAG TPA: phosphatidylglycerophosphatase A [Burkholderiaceae bacterium]|nr:phosphatidylglycerophosphatase A [Burkholderiaceae bacterium]
MSSTIATPVASSRPDARFLWSHPAHMISLGFGCGLSPVAPGTVGTLWAWLSFVVLDRWLGDLQWAVVLGAALLVGLWAGQTTARRLGEDDPSPIVWDEIVCFWWVLWFVTPAHGSVGGVLWTQAAAFAWFRFFDAVKPGPVAWADRRFKGEGWRGALGIYFDDIVAAFCTLLVFAVWRAW